MATPPDRVFLKLENVRGTGDAQRLDVTVNGTPAGTVSLFGLRKASLVDGHHGGSGLTFRLEITDIMDTLHLQDALAVASLDVQIKSGEELDASESISIGRVSINRLTQS